MNSKERMNLAMRGQKPDRIPLMCQFSLGYLAQNFIDDLIVFWYTPKGLSNAYIKAAGEHGFDGILVSITGRDPKTRENILRVEESPNGGMLVTWKNGMETFIPPNDFPQDRNCPVSGKKPESIEDLDVDSIHILTADDLPAWQFNILDDILERKGGELSIHGEVGTCLEEFLNRFDRLENGLIALLEDEERAKNAMERLNQNVILLAREQCRRGIDALKLSSPFAGAGFISREMYKKFVLPYEKELIDTVHEEFGLPCYIHTCGAIGDRLDLMLETDTDGLECLDPPPLGTVDLKEASRVLGAKAFIKGNLDSVNELCGADSEKVLEIARQRLEIGEKHPGGYILSTACSIAPNVPPENVSVLRKAAEG